MLSNDLAITIPILIYLVPAVVLVVSITLYLNRFSTRFSNIKLPFMVPCLLASAIPGIRELFTQLTLSPVSLSEIASSSRLFVLLGRDRSDGVLVVATAL